MGLRQLVELKEGYCKLYIQDSCVGKLIFDRNRMSSQQLEEQIDTMFEWLGENGYQYQEWNLMDGDKDD